MPEHDKAEVAHRRVGHELFHVRLHHRDQGAVDDADHGQNRQVRRKLARRLGEERKRKAQQAVRAHLQEHAGQNHRPRGWRFDVSVGQPGVERKQRHLDRKRERERQEQPGLQGRRDVHRDEIRQVEARHAGDRLVVVRNPEDRDQHQHAAGHGVEDELHGGVDATLVSPDADEEIHRNQHRVPEEIEEEEIERQEHADHRRFEREHEEGKLAHSGLDRLPRTEERDRCQEGGQDDEEQADAVDPEVIGNAELGQPRVPLDELIVGARGVELRPHDEADDERHERNAERQLARELIAALARGQDDDPAGERQRDEQRQKRHAVPTTGNTPR